MKTHKLVKTETYQIPLEQQKEVTIFEGTEIECFGKFLRSCSFSFSNHKGYSYTHYDIKEL